MQRRVLSRKLVQVVAAGLAGLSLPGVASAREPSADAREQAALAHADAGEVEDFAKCGAALVELYNDQAAGHGQPDRLLYNAASCFDEAGQVGQAVQARTILLERYPNSEFAKDTLFDLAERYADVAYYLDAAARYEQFSAQYENDERAKPALENAYLFRVGLSDKPAAIADLERYEALYVHDDSSAAGAFWSHQDLLDSAKQRRKHALDYLAKYGEDGGVDRMIVAETVIAQADWRRSCREPLLLDACVSVARQQTRPAPVGAAGELLRRYADRTATPAKPKRYRPPKRCASPTSAIVTVHRRDAKLATAAQERFAKILKGVNRGNKELARVEDDQARMVAFKQAWGAALFYRADGRFEEYLQIELPDKLTFVIEEWRRKSGIPDWERKYKQQVRAREDSHKRLYEFIDRKHKLRRELEADYAAVKETGSPYWILAAAMRTASLYQHFADQLLRAKIPRNLSKEIEVTAYCDRLADPAHPIAEQALHARAYCIERSTEFQYFNEFSRACEAEANLLDPERYPPTYELFGESVYAGTGLQSTGVLADPGDFIDPSEPELP